jgi:hypothetical protein
MTMEKPDGLGKREADDSKIPAKLSMHPSVRFVLISA